MSDTELQRLQADSFEKLNIFLKTLHKSIDSGNSNYDFLADIKYLEENSPQGIEFKNSVEKLNKYKA